MYALKSDPFANDEELILRGVRFSFRIHQVVLPQLWIISEWYCEFLPTNYLTTAIAQTNSQVAGGFDEGCRKAFQELKTQLSSSCNHQTNHTHLTNYDQDQQRHCVTSIRPNHYPRRHRVKRDITAVRAGAAGGGVDLGPRAAPRWPQPDAAPSGDARAGTWISDRLNPPGTASWAAPSQRLSRLLPKRRCWHRRRRGGGATAWEEERVEVKARVGGGAVKVAEWVSSRIWKG
jgi:hypothetical protein